MNKEFNSEQNGRSMVEMLGVLAIIGVLSVGGIAGYSKAMAKYRTNKTIDQVSMLITNIRTLYANQNNYVGLNDSALLTFELVSQDMITTTAGTSSGTATTSLINPFGGAITVTNNTNDFTVTYANIDKQACISIVTADWGASASGGLTKLTIGTKAHTWGGASGAGFPIDLATAATECDPGTSGTGVSIAWTYR